MDTTETLATPAVEPLQLIERQGGSFADARNEGVVATQGEWVAFLDDDVCAIYGRL